MDVATFAFGTKTGRTRAFSRLGGASRPSRAAVSASGGRLSRPSAPAGLRRSPGPASPSGQDFLLLGARVLLVEDNEINAMMARAILENLGLEVATAVNGQEALLVVHSAPFDVVLMDLHMPVLDGFQAARAIRADPNLQALPILAMTADAQLGVQEKVLEAGMNGCITKPFDPPLLFETLRQWIHLEARVPPADHGQAAAQELADALPGLNTREALARLDGNESIYLNFLDRFVEFHGDVMVRIRKALDAGDITTAARQAHSIKGASGNLGAEQLGESAHALGVALHGGGNQEIGTALAVMEKSLALVLETIAQIRASKE